MLVIKVFINITPKNTAELMSNKPYVNKRVIDLILNHEENLAGEGPMRKKTLQPLEETLALLKS
jgi:hypothetical protein